MAVVENHARIGVIDAVIDVVTPLPVAIRLADHRRHRYRRRRHEEPSGLGEDFDVFRKQAVQLRVQDFRQLLERLDVGVVRRGKPPPISTRFILSNPRSRASLKMSAATWMAWT